MGAARLTESRIARRKTIKPAEAEIDRMFGAMGPHFLFGVARVFTYNRVLKTGVSKPP